MAQRLALYFLLIGLLCGCGRSEKETAELNAFLAEYETKLSKERSELGLQWSSASDEQRLEWLNKCRSAILAHANRNTSYSGFFVGVYSADVHQVAVLQNGYSVEREGELKLRIAEYHDRASRDPMKSGLSGIDTQFVVVRSVPLDGKRNFHVSQYRCDMTKNFGVSVI